MKQRRLPLSPSGKVEDDNGPLSGVWIHWGDLSVAERLVCANIILLPAWWVVGLAIYMPTLILLGIALYKGLRLKRPSFSVAAFLAFSTYQFVGSLFFRFVTSDDVSPIWLFKSALFWFPLAFLLWYIQSNNIKIRPEVAAWAFSVSVVQMIGFWLVVHFIFGERPYIYPRTLFSIFTNNAEDRYEAGNGLGNYLIPYSYNDKALSGLARWSFFFPFPEACSLVVGFIGLLALDIKNRLWSMLLFVGCVFLMIISGTRSVWITFPIVVGLRYLLTLAKAYGSAILFALIAMVSFTTVSLPSVTEILSTNFGDTAKSTANARADSTEVRQKIYTQTLEHIPDNLLLGHWVAGPIVLPGFELGRVGTHSFILGTLLYRLGLVGTGIFTLFWISIYIWFYQTRSGRPLSCYCLLIFFTLVSPVMEFGDLRSWMAFLLCAAMRSPTVKLTQHRRQCALSS